MLARRKSRRRARGANNSYWMSYSDMMAALLLMFVLLLFLSFTRYVTLQDAKETELAAKEDQLLLQEAQLRDAQDALSAQEGEMADIRLLLSTQAAELEENQRELEHTLVQMLLQQMRIKEQEIMLAVSQSEISDAQEQLRVATADLESRAQELETKDEALLAEQERVSNLESQLQSQRDELDTQAERIDELVGVRSRIITQLRDAFAQEGLNVTVDQNSGAITMDSTVFFDTDQYYLTYEGRELLNQLLPIYFQTLMSPENAEFVAEIIVEGHTDSVGSYEHNLELSQRRAQAVVYYCMSDEFTGLDTDGKELLRTMISANGRAWSQLIYNADGTENRDASRRVEIKFRLKDAEMIESLSQMLNEIEAAPVGASPDTTAEDAVFQSLYWEE